MNYIIAELNIVAWSATGRQGSRIISCTKPLRGREPARG